MSLIYIMRGRSLVSERGLGVETASLLLQSLGGTSNIQDIEPCMLRIRIEVKSPEKVDDTGLRLPEVLAVVRSGHVIQLVLGAGAGKIALQMLHLCLPHGVSAGTQRSVSHALL